jgi:hypothetical protein
VRQHFDKIGIREMLEGAGCRAASNAVLVFQEGLKGGVQFGAVHALEGILEDAVGRSDAWIGLEQSEACSECCVASGIGGV